jgi:ABC-type branched-subunit amino acid transport system substrate-binding protein
MDRFPLRVGVLHDFPRPDGGAAFEWAVRLGVAEVATRLPLPLTFVHVPADGGRDHLAAAFARLVDDGVLAILGPALTDGALAVAPLADEFGVPCINYAGNEEARNAWLFHYQIGSLEDEPSLLVGDLARRGCRRVALIHDTTAVGVRMADFFAAAAPAAGCEVTVSELVDPDGLRATAAVSAARHTTADSLAYVGFWQGARAVALERRAQGWSVPAVANSALMYGHADAAWARDFEGWTYADTYSEANPRFAALARTLAAAGRTARSGEAAAYDMGYLLGEALVRAPALTPDGVRTGLEHVKALPAASGHRGTLMGFGRWDRGALKGPYLVLRAWRDGRSVEHASDGS